MWEVQYQLDLKFSSINTTADWLPKKQVITTHLLSINASYLITNKQHFFAPLSCTWITTDTFQEQHNKNKKPYSSEWMLLSSTYIFESNLNNACTM